MRMARNFLARAVLGGPLAFSVLLLSMVLIAIC